MTAFEQVTEGFEAGTAARLAALKATYQEPEQPPRYTGPERRVER